MKLLTPQQMKEIDRTAIETLGIPGIVLMENAARSISEKASTLLQGKSGARITIAAGSGNNGGDAFAVARQLLLMGHQISVYSMTDIDKLSGDALINARILINMGMEIPVISDESTLKRFSISCIQSDLVIDGLFGTGLNRDVEGIWGEVIDIINENAPLVLSIDIASGVDGLTGRVRGKCVRADATVTFFMPKIGMVQYPGAQYMGELTVADIGIPYDLAAEYDTPELLEKEDILPLIPGRPHDAHKGTFGRVLAIAGSRGMTGAAYLCAISAYRTGSGLVRMAVPDSCIHTVSALIPEAVLSAMPDKEGHIFIDDDNLVRELIRDVDAVLVGPGLKCNQDTHRLIKAVVDNCEQPVVFDADALNIMAMDKSLLDDIRGEAIITPHPAEMARLTGLNTAQVQQDRISIARKFADEYGLTVVLKGARTVIASNDGRIYINSTGNDGMATAGSGDTLAGIILSFLGQGLEPCEAACAGVYLHGLAGDLASIKKGRAGVIASDIADNIPEAYKKICMT
ncbi:MAG: NAD(P)H-hydrate dehydratase [Clostridiaceae bacterium]|nr:NAD(P)H-hydrate dehydratase [Clostridiaceae bacterium]